MTVLDTERLSLRRFTLEDAAFALRLLNEPSFLQNIGDKGVRTLEQAEGYLLGGPIKSYEAHGHGLYRVALKDTGASIGICGLLKRDYFEDADLGYAFLPEFWSKGFALESASAVLAFERRARGFTKILATVAPGNADSIKLLQKLGFAFSKTLRIPPETVDVALYTLAYPPPVAD